MFYVYQVTIFQIIILSKIEQNLDILLQDMIKYLRWSIGKYVSNMIQQLANSKATNGNTIHHLYSNRFPAFNSNNPQTLYCLLEQWKMTQCS